MKLNAFSTTILAEAASLADEINAHNQAQPGDAGHVSPEQVICFVRAASEGPVAICDQEENLARLLEADGLT